MVAVRRSDASFIPTLPANGGALDAKFAELGIRPESLYAQLFQGPDSFDAAGGGGEGRDIESAKALRQRLDRNGDGKLDDGVKLPAGMNGEDLLAMLIDYVTNYQRPQQPPPPPRTAGSLGNNGNYQSGAPVQGGWGGGGSSGGASGASGGGSTGGTGATAPVQPAGTAKDIKGAKHEKLTAAEKADVAWDRLSPRMREAAEVAKGMGLTVTSGAEGHDGDGVHTSGSNHYKGLAIDVSGDPAKMAAFYDLWKGQKPKELFYDPRGAIKDGQTIDPVGGHDDHVHLALD